MPLERKPDRGVVADPAQDSALTAVAGLTVKGRAPMTGFERDRFGPAWLDADRNGCDTRNDMLNRDLIDKQVRAGTAGCVVERGRLNDPFTGSAITHVRGHGALVDVDHVVALGNSWSSGSWRWKIAKRAAFANDALNLLAVDAGANRAKADGDAATWLPPSKSFRCSYVARQVAVKKKYALNVTPAEKQAMLRVLNTCPAQRLPADSGAPLRVDHNLSDPGTPQQKSQSKPAPSPRPQPAQPGGGPVYFENCDAARAAGAAPVRTGDPGYGRHLERDGDGSGCE